MTMEESMVKSIMMIENSEDGVSVLDQHHYHYHHHHHHHHHHQQQQQQQQQQHYHHHHHQRQQQDMREQEQEPEFKEQRQGEEQQLREREDQQQRPVQTEEEKQTEEFLLLRRAHRSRCVPGPVEGPWAGLIGWECRFMSTEVAKMLLKMEKGPMGEGLRQCNLAVRAQRAAVREEMILVTTEEAEMVDQARMRVLAEEKEKKEKGALSQSPTKIKTKTQSVAATATGSSMAMDVEGLSSSSSSSISSSSSNKPPAMPLPPVEALVEERPVSKALMACVMAREAKARFAAASAAAAAPAAENLITAKGAAAAAAMAALPALPKRSFVGRVQAAYFKQVPVKVTVEEARELDELAGEEAEIEEKERLKKEREQQQQEVEAEMAALVAARKENKKDTDAVPLLGEIGEKEKEERMMQLLGIGGKAADEEKEEGEGGRGEQQQTKRGEERSRKRAALSSAAFGHASWEAGGGSSNSSSNSSSNIDLAATVAATRALLSSIPSLHPFPKITLAEDGGQVVPVSPALCRALMTLCPNAARDSLTSKVQSAVMSQKDSLHLPPPLPPSSSPCLGPAERVLLAQAQSMVEEGLLEPGMRAERKKKVKLLVTCQATEENGLDGGRGSEGGGGGGGGSGGGGEEEKDEDEGGGMGLFAVSLTREGIGTVQAWEAKSGEKVTSISLSSRLMALFMRRVTVFRTNDAQEARRVEEAEREGEGKRQRRAAAREIQQEQMGGKEGGKEGKKEGEGAARNLPVLDWMAPPMDDA